MSAGKHTPTPWEAGENRADPGWWSIYAKDRSEHAGADDLVVVASDMEPGNADFIVRACNEYDSLRETNRALLTACREALRFVILARAANPADAEATVQQLADAIALARGGK